MFSIARIREYLVPLIIISILFIISQYNYLLFHTSVELLSIIIIFSLYLFTRNTREYMNNNYLIFIGITLAFVGLIDTLHTFTYKGMSIIAIDGANTATQLWITARFLQGLAFMLAPFFLNRKLNITILAISCHIVLISILLSIFHWRVFPDCFIEGQGLTSFKKIAEYVISLLLLLAIINLNRHRDYFDKEIHTLLIISLVLSILSELSFTFYISVYGLSNLIGHLLKLLAFIVIYRAIIAAGVRNPHKILFRDLNITQEKLLESKRQLEIRVKEAVDEVEEKNKMLLLQSRHAQLGEMISGISHQWKQPLNNISMLSSAMIDAWVYDEFDEKLLKHSVDNIQRMVKEMNDILTDFLSFYSPQINETNFLLQDIMKPFEELTGNTLAHASIIFEVEVPGEIRINGKMNELLQVVLVIVNNARDAFEGRNNFDRKIKLSATEKTEEIVMTISDNAGGIAPDVITRIFEPYYSTKGDKGSGMGLYLVKLIIDKHFNGEITARNIPNGTEFRIILKKQTELD